MARPWWWRWAPALALIGLVPAGACGSGGTPSIEAVWTVVPAPALVSERNLLPVVETVSAGNGGPSLLGGVVVSAPVTTGHFFSTSSVEQVALWSALSLSGPWRPSALVANPGRDGPNETIKYIAITTNRAFAFGWRNSPTEGYPRPSPWLERPVPGGAWREVLEPREFFGGPDIIGFGGATVGADGYFVAGTWTAANGHTVAAVWRSADGQAWVRDSTDPSLQGRPGEIPYGTGVADGSDGVILIGTADIPTHQNPTARRGAVWVYTGNGVWRRAFRAAIDRSWPDSTFDAVVATPSGWLIAGSIGAGAAQRPAVWSVHPAAASLRATLLPTPPSPAIITGMAADRTRVIVAAVSQGRPVLWTAPLDAGRLGRWRRLNTPTGSGLQRVAVSMGSSGTIVSLVTKDESAVWTTPWH